MNREQTITTMKRRLDQWGAELEALEAKAESAGAAGRAELESAVATLKKRRTQAVGELDRLRAATDDAFDDMRGGLEKAWDRLGDSFKDAKRLLN
jgi:phage shock protein A